jgi:hypothetical protein
MNSKSASPSCIVFGRAEGIWQHGIVLTFSSSARLPLLNPHPLAAPSKDGFCLPLMARELAKRKLSSLRCECPQAARRPHKTVLGLWFGPVDLRGAWRGAPHSALV